MGEVDDTGTKGEQLPGLCSLYLLYHTVPSRTLLRDEKVPGPGTYEPTQDERGDNAEARACTGGARDRDGDRIHRARPQRHPRTPTPTLAPIPITTIIHLRSHPRPHLSSAPSPFTLAPHP